MIGTDVTAESRRALVVRWLPLEIVVIGLVVWSATRVLHLANADAILPGEMSTQRLTWFVWGQDRLGNVVPALAWPVQALRWNLAVQFGLLGLGWFGCTALFAANHLRGTGREVRPAYVTAATLASGIISMLVLTPITAHVFLFEQQYAFALLLFLLGLVGMSHEQSLHWALGIAAVLAAMMINPSLVLFAPVALLLPGGWPLTPIVWIRMAMVGACFAVTNLAMALLGDDSSTGHGYSEFSLRRSWRNLDDAFDQVSHSVHLWPALVVLALSAGVLIARWRHLDRRIRLTYVAAPAFALAWTAAFAGNTWVELNLLYPRYFFPLFAAGLLLLTAAITDLIVLRPARFLAEANLSQTLRHQLVATVLAVSAPLFAVWWISEIEIDILHAAEGDAALVREHAVDVVVGGYWEVWPVVIEAQAQSQDVFAVTYRGNALEERVRARISANLAADGTVTAMCLGVDAPTCIAALEGWSPSPLALHEPLASEPLVIALVAATEQN